MILINEGSMNIVSRCNELLLASKKHHEFGVHCDFLKGKGCSLCRFKVLMGYKKVVAGCR